jgi:uncharacterized membrane protein YbhN (UPF0104 family)
VTETLFAERVGAYLRQVAAGLRRHAKSIAITAGSGIAFLVVVLAVGKPDVESLRNADALWLLAGWAATALSILVLARRWLFFIRFFSCPPPVGETYTLLAWLSLCMMFLPKELVEIFGRTWWLKRKCAIPYVAGASTVFADRLLDVLGLGAVLAPAACFLFLEFSPQALLLFLASCIALGAAAFVLWGGRSFFLLYALLKWLNSLVARLLKKESALPELLLPEIPRATLLWAYALTLFKFFLTSFSYWAFARSIGIQASLWTFILIVPVIQFFFLVSFTAGGAGFIEAGWYIALNALGTGAASINTYLVAQRLFVTVALAVTALLAYGLTCVASTFRKRE